jgi:hypothetical protein
MIYYGEVQPRLELGELPADPLPPPGFRANCPLMSAQQFF